MARELLSRVKMRPARLKKYKTHFYMLNQPVTKLRCRGCGTELTWAQARQFRTDLVSWRLCQPCLELAAVRYDAARRGLD